MVEVCIHFESTLNRFVIDRSKVDPVLEEISGWIGWRRTPEGRYVAPAYQTSMLSIRTTPGVQVKWTQDAQGRRDEMLREFLFAQEKLKGTPKISIAWPTQREPRPHQVQAIESLRHLGWSALLTDDMGLGKTATALWSAWLSGKDRICIICPVTVKWNWFREFEQTLGENWNVVVIDGTKVQRAQAIARMRNPKRLAVIVNYDLLRWLDPQQFVELVGCVAGGVLICDESHYLKNPSADRTQLVQQIAQHMPHRLLLSGTPIRNLADDLFSQIELVQPKTWSSARDFAKRYLIHNQVRFGAREVNKVIGTRNMDELNSVLNCVRIGRKKTEVISLPPKVHTYPELRLEGDDLKVYESMRKFARMALAELDPTVTVFEPRAKSAIEAAMRCEQIAQGFMGGIPDPVMQQLGGKLTKAEKIPGRPGELMFPNSPKIVWLLETIDSILKQGGAPVVFCRFNAPMLWMKQHLEKQQIRCGLLIGGITAQAKTEQIDGFRDKAFDVMLCQVKIAEGFNLTRSQDVIFYGRDWSPAINAQAEDRCHRMGQTGTVQYQIPVVTNTIERLIHNRLATKDADAQQALRTLTVAELLEGL